MTTFNISWNSRDDCYHIDKEGEGYLTALPTFAEALAWIAARRSLAMSKGDRLAINFTGDLFA